MGGIEINVEISVGDVGGDEEDGTTEGSRFVGGSGSFLIDTRFGTEALSEIIIGIVRDLCARPITSSSSTLSNSPRERFKGSSFDEGSCDSFEHAGATAIEVKSTMKHRSQILSILGQKHVKVRIIQSNRN